MNGYSFSSLDTFKNGLLEEVKIVKYSDLEDLLCRFQLTYDEIIDILDSKYIPTKRISYSLNPGIYEITDINRTLEHILPENVKVSLTIDDITLKSNLKFIQTLIFTEKSFFYTVLGFSRALSYLLNVIDGVYQLTAGSKKTKNILTLPELINFI